MNQTKLFAYQNPCITRSGYLARKLRKTSPIIIFLVLFTLVTFLQPVGGVLAEDGLAVNSPARVANTDGDGVRLRDSGSASASVIQVITENELVTIKGGPVKDKQGNSFYKVDYNGKTGYAMAQYLIFAGKVSKNFKGLPAGSPAKVSGTNGDGANMRQQASAGSSVLAVLSEGTVVTIVGGPFADKQGNNFYRVNNNGQTGYVTIAYLGAAPKNATTGGGGGFMKVTNTDGDPIRFRTGPARSAEASGYVYEGQVLKLLGGPVKDDNGVNWYRVERDGSAGYVDGTYLAKTSGPASSTPQPAPKAAAVAPAPKPAAPAIQAPGSNGPLGQRIVSYAKQFLGWRYVWGGSSPAAGGFDCSGFVHWVMTQNGVAAGHSVIADLEIGSPVPLDQIQPGDVLIWVNTYTAGPSHSGIYIGGGKFIHAETEATGVTIDDMSESYYASRLYAARRPGV